MSRYSQKFATNDVGCTHDSSGGSGGGVGSSSSDIFSDSDDVATQDWRCYYTPFGIRLMPAVGWQTATTIVDVTLAHRRPLPIVPLPDKDQRQRQQLSHKTVGRIESAIASVVRVPTTTVISPASGRHGDDDARIITHCERFELVLEM
ncbi:hypothetical protein EV182_004086 [Spiromyces aspiralis]|uniref:Uncharacterized protein n=1 Tax=Spiromyces aspiralis TaxID=68401 RepID=A0ACC1HEI7_9FUNG|nr:hypothetical protein EV182_004086 [Spiromyces aspiralis]